MKTLITGANGAKAYKLAWLLNLSDEKLILADDHSQQYLIAKENSPSYSHELLNFCLNHNITTVFPLKEKEVGALTEAKVLFSEYGIKVMVPNLNDLEKLKQPDDFSEMAPQKIVNSFNELSQAMIAFGYPSQTIGIGRADNTGNLIRIDDSQKNFDQLWNNCQSLSFTQVGKLFNTKPFAPLKVFQLEIDAEISEIDVLFLKNEIKFAAQPDGNKRQLIQSFHEQMSLDGFFRFSTTAKQLIRITPFHI